MYATTETKASMPTSSSGTTSTETSDIADFEVWMRLEMRLSWLRISEAA
jgi:hypothetical protein